MYYLFILGKVFCLIFPRDFCYFIAKILARGRFYCSKKDRDAVIYNLSPMIKDRIEQYRVARDAFVNFAYYLVDFFRYAKLNKVFLEKYVKVSGREYLDEGVSKNNGVVALTGHLGNYEMGGAVTALLGYPIYAVALPHKDKRTDAFFNRQRERTGLKVVPAGAAVKRCFSLLRNGKIVVFLADRNFSGGGVKSKMFSKDVFIPRGAFFFALKTGADITPCFFIREKKKFYRLIFEKSIAYNHDSPDTAGEEARIIKEYICLMEKYVKTYPEQWYMFQKYWIEE